MSGSFYERVLYEIRQRQDFYVDRIKPGNLTFDEYKSMTGKLIGLEEAEEAVKSSYKAMFENHIRRKDNAE